MERISSNTRQNTKKSPQSVLCWEQEESVNITDLIFGQSQFNCLAALTLTKWSSLLLGFLTYEMESHPTPPWLEL